MLDHLTGGGVLMVALWLQNTKTDVVRLLSFFSVRTDVFVCGSAYVYARTRARVRECTRACACVH